MDPVTGLMVAKGFIDTAGGISAGNAQASALKKGFKLQKKAYNKMLSMLEDIGVPTVEAQKILLEAPEYAGDIIAEKLGPSALEGIQLDPRFEQAQMENLRYMSEVGKLPMTPEERAQRAEMLRESAAQNQAQQQQILQSMAQRGNLDDGASFIAQLQSNAQQGTDARRQTEQLMSDMSQRKMNAIMNASNLAGSMQSSQFQRLADAAKASDQINQFNTANSIAAQRENLNRLQNVNNMASQLNAQQQIFNSQLQQQYFDNQMAKAKTAGNVQQNLASAGANYAQAQGKAQAGMYTGIASGIGQGIDAYNQYQTKTGMFKA